MIASFDRVKKILCISVLSVSSVSISSAQAGFEWVAPAEKAIKEAPVAKPVIENAPVTQGSPALKSLQMQNMEGISEAVKAKEILLEEIKPEQSVKPQSILEPMDAKKSDVMMEKPQPIMSPPLLVKSAPIKHVGGGELMVNSDRDTKALPMKPMLEVASEKSVKDMPVSVSKKPKIYAEVVGFGEDLPLALALSQIVPEGYAYSLGKGVNPGLKVDWSGGRSWPEVISRMVAEHGLGVSVYDKKVVVHLMNEKAFAPKISKMDSSSLPVAAIHMNEMKGETVEEVVPMRLASENIMIPLVEAPKTVSTSTSVTEETVKIAGEPIQDQGDKADDQSFINMVARVSNEVETSAGDEKSIRVNPSPMVSSVSGMLDKKIERPALSMKIKEELSNADDKPSNLHFFTE